ncbi:NUDIX domain-containing protein [Staphylococcus rostri]
MKCLLFGLGRHAQNMYWHYLSNETTFSKIIIVELQSAKTQVEALVADSQTPCETLFLDDSVKYERKLSSEVHKRLHDVVTQEQVTHAIIATEPRSHEMYIDFCLNAQLHILCNKPLTTPMYTNTAVGSSQISENFQAFVEKWQANGDTLFEVQSLKRTHKGYQYVRDTIEQIVKTYNVPINKINISSSSDHWYLPSDTALKETQPYKYGYGTLMHDGYHLIELLTFFTDINKKYGFIEAQKNYHVSDYRPSDFFKYYGKAFNEQLSFFDNDDAYHHLNIIQNFGEFELSAMIDYIDDEHHKIATANLQLTQAGDAQLPTASLSDKEQKPTYREFLEVSVGPLITIQVISYTSENGQPPYFDITIFKNTAILGGAPFEKLTLADIETNASRYTRHIGRNQVVSINALDDFFFHHQSHSNILAHQEEVEILTALHQHMAQKLDMSHFRFAVELIIEHNGKFLVCRRRPDVEVAPGLWNVPAGKVQYGESMDAAIIREAKEETNLDISDFSCLGYQFINKAHQRCVYTYHVKIDDISNIQIDRGEFDRYAWIDATDIHQYDSLNPHIKDAIVHLHNA